MSIYDFFRNLVGSILSNLGFPQDIGSSLATIIAVVLFCLAIVQTVRLAVFMFTGFVDAMIKASASARRMKKYILQTKSSQHNDEQSSIMLGAALFSALKRLDGKELDSLSGKSKEEVVEFLNERFGTSSDDSSNWKTAKIEKLLKSFE